MAAVLQEIGHGSRDQRLHPQDDGGPDIGDDVDAREAPEDPRDRIVDDDVEVDFFGLERPLVAACELDELVDEVAHLGELLDDVSCHLLAVAPRQSVAPQQELDVRAQARKRRAQLV
ncbi:MAG: hypothetical protein M3322_07365 [Actinomycetota bacterium]|nr:hypothetical protein [Actinomycetota bacterium]